MITITTPEHVEIQLEPAGAGSRFLAVFLDSAITFGIALLLMRIASTLLPRGLAAALMVTTSFFLSLGWHVWFETHGGRTPGKRALRLRVVDARGLPVSLHQALVRNIVRAVDFIPVFYGVGATVSMLDEQRRRFGDIVADTLVIRDARALSFRAELAAERRYNALRTPRVQRLIRHRISLEEREFLLSLCTRSAKMKPVARYDLMEEVAAHYRKKLGVEEEQISGENFVRDLTAVMFAKR